MGDTKRTPLVAGEDGTLADASTGEVLRAPARDPYTGAEVLPAVRPEVHVGPLPAHPADLQLAFDRWKDEREIIKRFLLEYLVESEYDEKGRPRNGRMHDYYKLPGKDDYRPTQVGAEKVALFFGLFKGPTEVHVLSEAKEYVSIRARMTLLDASGRVRGSAEKVGSSAEETFQRASAKYGNPPDWRAALNDIGSRIAKRAYVEAVTITCALGELFNEIAREKANQRKQVGSGQDQRADANRTADPKPDHMGRPTVMPVGAYAGVPLKVLDSEYLKKARVACNGRAEYSRLAEAIDELLEHRRDQAEGATT